MEQKNPQQDVWSKATPDQQPAVPDAGVPQAAPSRPQGANAVPPAVPDASADAPQTDVPPLAAVRRRAVVPETRVRRRAISTQTFAGQQPASSDGFRRRRTILPAPAQPPQEEPAAKTRPAPQDPAVKTQPAAPQTAQQAPAQTAPAAAPAAQGGLSAPANTFAARPAPGWAPAAKTAAPTAHPTPQGPASAPQAPAQPAGPSAFAEKPAASAAAGPAPQPAGRAARQTAFGQKNKPAVPAAGPVPASAAAPSPQEAGHAAARSASAAQAAAPTTPPPAKKETPARAGKPRKKQPPAGRPKAADQADAPLRGRRKGRAAKPQPAPPPPQPAVAAWERIASEVAGPPPEPGLSQWEPAARPAKHPPRRRRSRGRSHTRRTAAQRLAACKRGLQRTSAWVGDTLYEIGYYAEYAMVRLGRTLKHAALVALRWLGIGLYWVLRLVMLLPVAVFMMFGRLFWHMFSAVRNVHEIWYTRDPDKPGETWKNIFRYLGGGVVRHAHLVPDLLGWALPILAGMVFVFTVRTVFSYEYVLQVSYNDQVLGYVASENVVETAQQDVQNRIIYVEGEDNTQWEVRPTFALTINDDLTVMDVDQMADAILRSSGEEIVEASGFYIDGRFYGAITDRARLEQELEDIKAPYYTGVEGEYVSFVTEPEFVDGVYLRSSVVETDGISEMLHAQVAGEVRYTVEKGDTPSGIASAHGLTTAELVSMNPDRDIINSLYPGDSLVVSQAVSFLQVKVTYRRTEQEEVPYSTVRTNTEDLAFGVIRTKTAGVNGVNECEYDYVYIDGVLQSKTLISTTVISEPVTEELLVGTTVRAGVTMVPSTGAYMWPIPGYTYVSRGFTGLYAHNGMDICGRRGTPIYAAQGGVVTRAVYTNRGYGIYVIIDHGGGYSTLYGHCSDLAVSTGDVVTQGQLIAYVGSTGNSTGPHCHFEVRIGGDRGQVNPADYVGYG